MELPPLRHHIEDLNELVPFFIAKLNQYPRLVCSSEAMQLLLRSGWPGNTEQLWQVLRKVVQHRCTGVITPNDLPPECWTVSRRLLSPLESMEREMIVQSLLDYKGNKVKAAESLGMSRATIYRKIHEYGIVTPSKLIIRAVSRPGRFCLFAVTWNPPFLSHFKPLATHASGQLWLKLKEAPVPRSGTHKSKGPQP